MRAGEQSPKVVLIIAGFDPSGGAGVLADAKTVAAHGLYATAAITALTVQSTQGVHGWESVESELLQQTLEYLVQDTPPAATKIGMLGSAEVAATIASFLESYRLPNVVIDPVLKSSSGTDLIEQAAFPILRNRLLSLAEVITPNLDEAARLANTEVRDLASMKAATEKLRTLGVRNIVVTGGHLAEPTDLLSETQPNGSLRFRSFPGERVALRATHGTGCAYSTSLACNLAQGRSLIDAVEAAKDYVVGALKGAYEIGKGSGPLNHFFA